MSVRNELPFAVVPEWLLDADVSDRAVRLYGILVRYADREGHAHPSRKTIALRLRCSTPSVDRALKELVTAGALVVHRRQHPNGDWDVNEYVLRPGGVTAAATGGVTDDEQNESQLEREEIPPVSPVPVVRTRARDELFEAFCDETSVDWHELSQARRGAINGMLASIRAMTDGVTAEEIRARAAEFRRRWSVPLTPESLVRRWSELGRRRVTATRCEECGGTNSHRVWCSRGGEAIER